MPRPSVARDASRRPARVRLTAGLACLTGLILLPAGCQGPTMAAAWPDMTPEWPAWASFRSQSPDEDESREIKTGTSLDTPMIGEYVSFAGMNLIPVQGVGLVVGLDKTGEDPPPSHYRTRLVDEMRKRKVPNPNEILASPNTALVLVRAYLPPIVRKGDTFDVEVILPPNTEATSLAGGHLLEARLAEQAVVGGGRVLDGDVLAVAAGPILVSAAGGKDGEAPNQKRGRILGGGESKADRDLAIFLRNEFRSGRNTVRISQAIGKRFHGHDKHGLKVPMAEPKNDQKIVLKVPEEYRDNYPRYLQVIRNIAFRETDVAQRVRLQKLEQQLADPEKSEVAALRLEGIGSAAGTILKRGLKHDELEVRFNAAMALTYMGEPDGLAALAEAAKQEPAFRVYACAALSASREAEASMHLKELLAESSNETRYGAFRALTVLNDQDPDISGEPMKTGAYKLHALDVGGPPLVHLTHYSKAEVVLFGADQELRLPAVLKAGRDILVAAPPGSDMVSVSRFTGGRDERKTVPPRLLDVLRACEELGASYPDVAALLAQADRQHNLAGAIAIDALPKSGRTFVRKDKDGKEGGKRTVGDENSAPNLYSPPDDEAARAAEEIAKAEAEKLKDEVVEGQAKKQPKRIGMTDESVRPASAGEEKNGVVTAAAEVPADDESDAPSQLPEDDDAAPLRSDEASEAPSQEGGPKWYDPRRLLTRPKWPGGSPPEQSEPGAD